LCTSLEREKKRLQRPPDLSGVCAAPSLRFITGQEDGDVAEDVASWLFSDAIREEERRKEKGRGCALYLS
jgi:hypothetical protein